MWSSLNTIAGLKGAKGTKIVHRDDLSKNSSARKVKKGDFLANKSPLISKEKMKNLGAEEEKGVIRVKVKMTKEEAARLMSKTKEGGVLEFRDVAHELLQIPMNRVNVVSSGCGFGAPLATIDEEI